MFLIKIKFHHIPFIPHPLLLPDTLPELLLYPNTQIDTLLFFGSIFYMSEYVYVSANFYKYNLLCPLFCLYRYGDHP